MPSRFVQTFSDPVSRPRPLLACGVAAPVLALAATLAAMAAYPGFNPARQYLSELGGAVGGPSADLQRRRVRRRRAWPPWPACGFGLAIAVLTRSADRRRR